jgi:glycosyltransferase involved in cell wall biosynthesis
MRQLTILIPAFNAAPYIEEAVISLLAQTFSDFDLWIIDDASTDETLNIIKSFQDPRIKIVANEVNQGRVRTINKLVKDIESPYFTITDADDVSDSTRLEKQLALLEREQSLMMCGTSFWVIDEQGFMVRELRLLTDITELRAKALHQSQFLGPTTIMRKEVVTAFPEFYRMYIQDEFADADLATQILDKYTATNIAESLYCYRILPSSLSRKNITPRNLNLRLLVGFLSRQRRTTGQDCLQRNAPEEANEFMGQIEEPYNLDPSFLFRHQAFVHLYWGLNNLALENVRLAVSKSPFQAKNWVSLLYIIFRIGLFYLNRSVNKVHYRQLMRTQ